MRIAIVKSGKVINLALLPDGWPNVPDPWTAPAGTTPVPSDTANTGDSYANGVFTPNPVVAVDPVLTRLNDLIPRIEALDATKRNKLLFLAAAAFIREYPGMAAQFGITIQET